MLMQGLVLKRINDRAYTGFTQVDSTGLKVAGYGEWNTRQHGVQGRRTWVKVHLLTDAATGLEEVGEVSPPQCGGVGDAPLEVGDRRTCAVAHAHPPEGGGCASGEVSEQPHCAHCHLTAWGSGGTAPC